MTIDILSMEDHKLVRAIPHSHTDIVNTITFSADSKIMLTASCDRKVKTWDLETGKHLKTYYGHTDWVNVAEFSPDG